MKIISKNKKALFDYFIEEKYEVGIELMGSEVKSIRDGRINLKDSFCKIENGQMFMYSVHISPYPNANIFNHEPERKRRLLLHKKEIIRIHSKIKENGLTLIPLKVYLKENGYIKFEIGLAKGKKLYDKRESMAKKDFDRKIKQQAKYNY